MGLGEKHAGFTVLLLQLLTRAPPYDPAVPNPVDIGSSQTQPSHSDRGTVEPFPVNSSDLAVPSWSHFVLLPKQVGEGQIDT